MTGQPELLSGAEAQKELDAILLASVQVTLAVGTLSLGIVQWHRPLTVPLKLPVTLQ
jgi:hypothetical protein